MFLLFNVSALAVKSQYFLSPLLIGDYSEIYYHYITKVLYYIPYICISFLTVGMILQYVSNVKRRKKQLLAVLMFILAVFAGMEEPRQVVILYLPIVMSSTICFLLEMKSGMIHEKFLYMILCAANFIFSVIGCFIIFKILSKKYQFAYWRLNIRIFL